MSNFLHYKFRANDYTAISFRFQAQLAGNPLKRRKLFQRASQLRSRGDPSWGHTNACMRELIVQINASRLKYGQSGISLVDLGGAIKEYLAGKYSSPLVEQYVDALNVLRERRVRLSTLKPAPDSSA
ncbi:hypothetical protein HZC07_00275 [Candidatus Micrarchaeota archaeon]|nr:hypothetical protein [Candidatus Micrarchaeota archaeon]